MSGPQSRRLDPLAGEIRAMCGISQQTVADALGITRAAVSGMECGRIGSTGKAALAYRRVLAGLARHLAVEVPGD